ncbi:MAG: type 1 glutamine amidotransferase [Candidatus Omnitrophica bacterium]|nr:type 1 glutamine amidotransferase [Candidatus Omnitrophota bacterium]
MSKIAVLIDEGFEDSEYLKPAKALRGAGHEIFHLGLKKGAEIKGKSGKVKAHIDQAISDATVGKFDALLIPGGYSPDHLRAHDEAVRFTKNFVQSGKPVFSICHGPQLLITAKVLEGRKITGWKSIIQDIKNAGAHFVDEEVVEDGNIISSRSPQDIPAFNHKILEKLEQLEMAMAPESGTRN